MSEESTTSKIDLAINKNTTFRRVFALKDAAGYAIDLSSCTIKAALADSFQKRDLINLNAVIDNPIDGKFSISLSEAETSAIEFSTGKYDVLITFPDVNTGTVRVVEGDVVVKEGITS